MHDNPEAFQTGCYGTRNSRTKVTRGILNKSWYAVRTLLDLLRTATCTESALVRKGIETTRIEGKLYMAAPRSDSPRSRAWATSRPRTGSLWTSGTRWDI